MRRPPLFSVGIGLFLLAHMGWAQDRFPILADRTGIQPEEPCASLPVQPAETHELPVIGISFSGNLRMPVADQNLIAAELKRLSYSEPLDGASAELVERVRQAWQDRGFFEADVNGNAILTSRGADHGLALSVHVTEGPRYRLGGISFQHNKTLTNAKALRALFPIKDGEAFLRSDVAEGLNNLRKSYGEYGFIDYRGVPHTKTDNATHKIYVVVDIDERQQFYVESIEVLGLDDTSRRGLVTESPLRRGSVYNARLDELFLGRIKSHFPNCGCSEIKHNRIDERKTAVVLTYNLGACAVAK